MLSEKPWKSEAILRLFVGVFICVLIGAVISSGVEFACGSRELDGRLFAVLLAGALSLLAGVLYLVRRPWPIENAKRHFMALLACLYGGLILASLALHFSGKTRFVNPIWLIVIGTLSFQGGALLLIRGFLREHQISLAEAFGLNNQPSGAFRLGVAWGSVYLPIGFGLKWILAQAMSYAGQQPAEQSAVAAARNARGWLEWTALGAVVILLAPIAEEILFRGLLYAKIKQTGFPRLALWGTAALFAAVHVNAVDFLPLLMLAVVLALLYEWSNNLLAPIVAHGLFNAVNFAYLFLATRSSA